MIRLIQISFLALPILIYLILCPFALAKGLPTIDPKNLRLSGFFEVYGGADLEKETDTEHLKSFRNRIRFEAKYTLASPKKDPFSLIKQKEPYFILSAESDYLWFGSKDSENDYDLDLYEAYFNWDKGPWQLRLGKQIVRWGKTDQISPVNNLNPQDMRRFILDDLEDRKIPNWMARVRFFQDMFNLEGIFIPFFEPNDLDYFDTDWAVYRHTREQILDSAMPPNLKQFVRGLNVDEDEPAKNLENAQAGLRISTTLRDIDLAASYLYSFDPMPYFDHFPIKNIEVNGALSRQDIERNLRKLRLTPGDIQVEYRRSHIYGLEFETVLGDFGLRGESVYFDEQTFLKDNLTSTQKPVLHTVLGIDYTGEHGLYANFQVSDQEVFDHQDDILFFERHNVSINGELSQEWARGTWEASFQGAYFITDKSSHLDPSLSYKPISALRLTLGLHLFQGDRDTILGQYKDSDEAYLRMKYFF